MSYTFLYDEKTIWCPSWISGELFKLKLRALEQYFEVNEFIDDREPDTVRLRSPEFENFLTLFFEKFNKLNNFVLEHELSSTLAICIELYRRIHNQSPDFMLPSHELGNAKFANELVNEYSRNMPPPI